MKQKILIVNLNEINLEFIKKNSKKYNCKEILKFLKKKNKVNTFSKDKIQHKDLDPWVQEVSINTGLSSRKHKIFNLGEKLDQNIPQIWDLISKKYKVSIWGSMNSQLRNNKNINYFFPDPWNFTSQVKPKNLKNFFLLPNYYAKNYTKINILKFTALSLKLISFLSLNKLFYFNILKNFYRYLKAFTENISKINFKLFLLLDIFSLISIRKLETKNKSDVLFVFLNSIAHFQHNNWDEKKNYKIFFSLLEILFKELNLLEKEFETVLVYNGFSQKKIKKEYLLRPIDPKNFLIDLKIKFKKLEQNMTNGGIIFFNNSNEKNKYFNLMQNYKICGHNLFDVKKLSKNSVFYKIAIKTYSTIITPKNFKYSIAYNDNVKNKLSTNSIENMDIFKKFTFIKTTGSHINKGFLIFNNLNEPNTKSIENRKIFFLIKNYLNV
tara:strand:+ start:103 stop:1416 length:1314 start_codon:yes stop_codon:yes gene_type:complete